MPDETSARISPIALRSGGLAVCSSSTESVRSSDMPDPVSVANWREKIERSFSVTRLPPIPGMLISFCMPWPDRSMERGTMPRWRSI